MLEERIPVEIFGQTYEILGDSSQTLYYNSLARYVEEKMREIKLSINIVSDHKIAVLAALNIADELFQDKEKKNTKGHSADLQYEELIELIDNALKNSSQDPTQQGFKELETV